MSRTSWTILLFLAFCAPSLQEPTFFKATFKGLNGVVPVHRVHEKGEIRAVYYHDQTVAIVDLGQNNELHNCDLIEVYEHTEVTEVLKNLSTVVYPQQVSFPEMTKLMQQCELLDKMQRENSPIAAASAFNRGTRIGVSSLTLLSGIIPGTKWCGTGDIAESYHDLGQEVQIDRCCRNHDLCPVKVRAQQTRYNLTNYSIYTKSHCTCDEALYHCLKAAKHPTANILGHIYFNLVRVPCIEDISNEKTSWGPERRFIPVF